MGINLHQDLIDKNYHLWYRKSLLHKIYNEFYKMMAEYISDLPDGNGKIVELGSGMGNIHEVIPTCVRTELFPYPWIDQVENAYELTFADASVSNLMMVDVFHHLKYPGTALKEFHRILKLNGRVIMMEPGLSVLGYLVYGLFHPEPIGTSKEITWFAPEDWSSSDINYYSSQGNATRIFIQRYYADMLGDWKVVEAKRIVSVSYVACGGYSGPQLYPAFAYPLMKFIDKTLSGFPSLFTTRLLVVLEKK